MSKRIICNKCGKTLDFWDEQEKYSISTTCGYGSKHDGATIRLDLCCACFDELVDSCEESPVIEYTEYGEDMLDLGR